MATPLMSNIARKDGCYAAIRFWPAKDKGSIN